MTIQTGMILSLNAPVDMAADALKRAEPVTKLAVTFVSSALVERAPQSP